LLEQQEEDSDIANEVDGMVDAARVNVGIAKDAKALASRQARIRKKAKEAREVVRAQEEADVALEVVRAQEEADWALEVHARAAYVHVTGTPFNP
jgi:D-arabinose 1-dehydrogenase-like Zn-dependent alcohol dehydrogenase